MYSVNQGLMLISRWTGVLAEKSAELVRFPSVHDRYIHKVISESEFDIIITPFPDLANLVCDVDYTLHNNTYKCVLKWKEWEVVVWCKCLMKCACIYSTMHII